MKTQGARLIRGHPRFIRFRRHLACKRVSGYPYTLSAVTNTRPNLRPPFEGSSVAKPADRSITLVLIGLFKLFKALLLIIVAVTAFHLVNKDLTATIEGLAARLHLDPGNKYVRVAISRALNISPKKLELVGTITLVYAGLFATEGVGLLLGKRWAEYMTIITTSGLLPLEIYELFHKPGWVKAITLLINVAAVVYLVLRVRRMRKEAEPAVVPAT
jgi:uncharacterized membrane protein (DUF2068 family)